MGESGKKWKELNAFDLPRHVLVIGEYDFQFTDMSCADPVWVRQFEDMTINILHKALTGGLRYQYRERINPQINKEILINPFKSCVNCDGEGHIQLSSNPEDGYFCSCDNGVEVNYYTPERYERDVLGGDTLPKDTAVWGYYRSGANRAGCDHWKLQSLRYAREEEAICIYLCIPGQKSPNRPLPEDMK